MTAQAAGFCRVEDLPEFVEQLLPDRQVYQPVPERHALYADLFEVYRRLSARLKEDFAALAAVVRKYPLE